MILNVKYSVQYRTKIEVDDSLQGEEQAEAIADALCDIEIPADGTHPTDSAYVADSFEVDDITDKDGNAIPF